MSSIKSTDTNMHRDSLSDENFTFIRELSPKRAAKLR